MVDPYESIRAVEMRVMALEQAHVSLNEKLTANTQLTSSIKADTADLVEFAKAAKGLVTVGRWIGKLLQWAAPIAAVVLGLWATVKGWKQ